ncbi:hypothetical protein CF336_g6920 [Tilletia laevis]|uniref:Uncharacterized protein n=1 Tax=Tilletia caries TaxID=13290 RepID=A0A177UYI7_9BASI|nr:hypothetical protein CF336_g6920 [Tilletia laevis]KAE8242416.1 hypothetical protein A4X03_0g8042 [Tilletia caries]
MAEARRLKELKAEGGKGQADNESGARWPVAGPIAGPPDPVPASVLASTATPDAPARAPLPVAADEVPLVSSVATARARRTEDELSTATEEEREEGAYMAG